ncbi:MAG: DNA-binding protein [Thermoprotei archaeon]|nr:MAG: DNA-binding protein [Thermoprotei archaeon]HDD63974.1 winged helix-turn-helix transcriptional regulator [Thermoprotei archaeon]
MPRQTTSRVKERRNKIIELLKKHGELPTVTIVEEVGLTHSQTFYILRQLLREGVIEEVKRGKVAYWRLVSEGEKHGW